MNDPTYPYRSRAQGLPVEGTWDFSVTHHGQNGFETTVRNSATDADEVLTRIQDAVSAIQEDIRIGKEVQRQMDANPEGPFAPWPSPENRAADSPGSCTPENPCEECEAGHA